MLSYTVRDLFFYGGVSRDEFRQVLPLVWRRNRRILRITSVLAALMGLVFLLYALLSKADTWLPYLVLTFGSLLIFLLTRLAERWDSRPFSMALCYGQMLLVCAYAGILSTQASNYAIPATSIVVFIALLPLSIDDRLIRMFGFMLLESVVYLLVSRLFKSSHAFGLDVMNIATFFVVGMVLYGVICTRNMRELYQGLRIESIQKSVITSMATMVEERDENTGGHILRTEDHMQTLIDRMKKTDKYGRLTEAYYRNILLAAPMHDIGKIRIPDVILNKPGRLTDEEYSVMKRHTVYGAEIIQKTMRNIEEGDYFTVACNIARYHHERYDGTGYPDGLRGEQIPLEARMMALADVYDALVSERVYKPAFSAEEARRIIREGAGTQFDPDLTALFLM